jgi:site-specific recombinase XerD
VSPARARATGQPSAVSVAMISMSRAATIGRPARVRHTFVTTMLDAGVDLRDVQIAARHADPRTTMRYDRARKNLDRHPN